MESTGSRRTAVETSRDSTQEKASKSSSSILHSALGPSPPRGQLARNFRMNPAASTKNYTTLRISARTGTTLRTTSSTSSGARVPLQSRMATRFLMIVSGSRVMATTRSIRMVDASSPGALTLIFTTRTTTGNLTFWPSSKEIRSSRHPSTCLSRAPPRTWSASQSTPRRGAAASLT